MEFAPIPRRVHSAIEDNKIHKVDTAITIRATSLSSVDKCRVLGKHHSRPFVEEKDACTMEYLESTFSETETSQFAPGFF